MSIEKIQILCKDATNALFEGLQDRVNKIVNKSAKLQFLIILNFFNKKGSV
jgi:hypothetical protein